MERDEVLCMSDLSNLLGDVYGDHSPDAAPVRREPAAADRASEWARSGDELTAALSTILTAPAPAPVMAPVSLPVAPAPIVDLAPAPIPAPSFSVSAPMPAMAGGGFWAPGDDDIFASARSAKKKK
jgi:anti-sigma factor RsiW